MEIKNYEPTESNIERLFLINWCQILNLRACDQLNTSPYVVALSSLLDHHISYSIIFM